MNAADDLLVEQGFTATTIEGIAARAGVAKQTIYRWWKSKVDILLDALVDDAREGLAWADPAGTPADDLTSHLRRVAAFFQEPAGQVLQALLGHARLDKDTAVALRDRFLRDQRERDVAGLSAILERHLGEAPQHETVDRLVDLLLGPVSYRILVLGAPVDEDLVQATVRAVLQPAD
ncbi:TetR/AcrR family transcriptional regulator [Streptomyces hydrogenans]|uniref:TetR/AcrR family transcriptional regulator n=1 Tax=Streptomyces hydrogenans TaxID=1873719 RepID=UPI0035D98BA0